MLLALKLFLGTWKNWIIGAVIAGLLSTLAFYVYEYDRRGRALEAVKIENGQFISQIKVMRKNEELAKFTVKELDGRLKQLTTDLEKTCRLYNALNDQTDPIGAVLDALKQGEKK